MPDQIPASTPVYLITHEFYPRRGGIATFTEEIAKATANQGFTTEVWAPAAPGTRERAWPFLLKRLPLKGTQNIACQLRLAMSLIRERRRLRYATVYLPEPGPMLAMMLLQNFTAFRPKRLVLTFHGSEILKFARNPFVRPLARQLINNASRISTLSYFTHQLLIKHFPSAAPKILHTPGALRSDFVVVPPNRERKKDRLVVLTVGRVHPRKGQLLTLQALLQLDPRFRNNIEYWIVGRTNRPRYQEKIADLAVEADFPVRFLGEVPDEELSQIYERADIFALTSVDLKSSVEGFGLVYLEAAAHGLPVVAHDVGGVSEAVLHGKTGILVPPNHPAQLAAAFERLISDGELRRSMGDAGLSWAQLTTWHHAARALFTPNAA